jgi:hypothetical protein
VLDLFRDGQLPQAGFVRQEDVPLRAFLANRFGRLYDGATLDAHTDAHARAGVPACVRDASVVPPALSS